uniref:tRNA (34-2'-O)-methyltransferase regulator WDR6 n=1 Tax=Glossina palpalis gambiensis TaxID=67801 RepID=A0A1B0ARY4_9MUSC
MVKIIETVADSIAIKLLNKNTIVTGKGNELHLYKRVDESIVEDVLNVKLKNKIHGIEYYNTNILLIYGEMEFILVQWKTDCDEFEEFYRAQLTDWISGAILLDNAQIALLTAHSVILRFQYDWKQKTCDLLERVTCADDKSTLYCTHLYGSLWDDLIIFSGNAFGELLIWQPSLIHINENKENLRNSFLLHRINAHNGVIFSIDYNAQNEILITTSDDRALKWWKVKKDEHNWSTSHLQSLASSYGHVARVFRGLIFMEGTEIYAVSVGEDSYLCLWLSSGELLFKRHQQYGAVIWNIAYDSDTRTVYTVGSCGNLLAYDLKDLFKQHMKLLLKPKILSKNTTEYIAKIKFLNEHELLGITSNNRLIKMQSDRRDFADDQKCHVIEETINFKCTVMEIYKDSIALAGYKRLVILLYNEINQQFRRIYDAEILKSVIRSFIFFDSCKYLVCDDQGNCMLMRNKIKCFFDLPKSKEPWLTAGLLLHGEQILLISNRQGHVLLYKYNKEENIYNLKHNLKNVHGNLGATKLMPIFVNESKALVCSSGHKSCLNRILVDFQKYAMKLCTKDNIPVAWVDDVVQIFKHSPILLGFNDNHFVAWSKNYDFLLQIPCGGGHRCWDYVISKTDEKFITLAFIQNKEVVIYYRRLYNAALLLSPTAKKWHTSSCNAAEIYQQGDLNVNIAITGGEDNLIKIHNICEKGLKQKFELHNHISNIRTIRAVAVKDYELFIFSGGGRAQLSITRVNVQKNHREELINYTIRNSEQNRKQLTNNKYNYEPETRLMALDVLKIDDCQYKIYIGCSDGYVRLLYFKASDTPEIQQISQLFYNKCILQLQVIKEENCVIVGCTEGSLKFFNTVLSECIYKIKHHQSGINALAVHHNAATRSVKMLSGGDDQAVCYTELGFSDDNQWKILNKFSRSIWHTAQVTAACILPNGLYGITGSLDQNIYKINLKNGEILESFHSCIADIKGVSCWHYKAKDHFLIYGCGYQVFCFDDYYFK